MESSTAAETLQSVTAAAAESPRQCACARGCVCLPAMATDAPACYLLLANSKSRHNVGTIVRSAVAFGVRELIVVGDVGARVATFGAQRTEAHLPMTRAPRVREALAALRARVPGLRVCGIEIHARAVDVNSRPWRGPTAFLAGAEGAGLCAAHLAECDDLVYIPQCGNGTASLNVSVAVSIVLQHFASWARYVELPREAGRDDKFAVVAAPPRHAREGVAADATRAARAAARAGVASVAGIAVACEALSLAGTAAFFDEAGASGHGAGTVASSEGAVAADEVDLEAEKAERLNEDA